MHLKHSLKYMPRPLMRCASRGSSHRCRARRRATAAVYTYVHRSSSSTRPSRRFGRVGWQLASQHMAELAQCMGRICGAQQDARQNNDESTGSHSRDRERESVCNGAPAGGRRLLRQGAHEVLQRVHRRAQLVKHARRRPLRAVRCRPGLTPRHGLLHQEVQSLAWG